jgi:hypothetical protein
MSGLVVSELARLRSIALVVAVAHLLALGASLDQLVGPGSWLGGAGLAAWVLGGLALGLVQVGVWRRGDLWIQLLHRPLAPGRILISLLTAGALVLLVAVALPLLLALGLLAAIDPQGVDPQQFLLPPYALGAALASYLLGCLVATARRWLAMTMALPIGLFLLATELGVWVFVPLGLALLWLALVLAAVFVPDPATSPQRPLAVVAALLPLQITLYVLLSFGLLLAYSLGVAGREAGWAHLSRFAWNDYFPAGSYPRTAYLDAPEALAHGLRLVDSAATRELAALVAEIDVQEIAPTRASFPASWQTLPVDPPALLADQAHQIRWTFRRDRMLFAGQRLRTGQAAGWLGAAGVAAPGGMPDRFPAVPAVDGDRQLLTAQTLYRFDSPTQRVTQRFVLADGERFVSPVVSGASLDLALTDRALYLFAPGALLDPAAVGTPIPFAVVTLPDAVANLDRALATRVGATSVVSFVYGRRSERGFSAAHQVLFRLDNHETVLVGDRPLAPGAPSWVRHRAFLVSPLLQLAEDLVRRSIGGRDEGAETPRDAVTHWPPFDILVAAIGLAVAAAVATWLLARHRLPSPTSRLAWTAAALLLGPPVPLSLLLAVPRPDS